MKIMKNIKVLKKTEVQILKFNKDKEIVQQ